MLEARGLDKSFPGVHALRAVDFDLRAGEVHGLMGENGAGKSTLIKVLTGALRPDAGTVSFLGRAIRPESPAAAQRLGIAAVYQEVHLVPEMSVAENLFLGRFPRRGFWIDRRRMLARAREVLSAFGLGIDPRDTLSGHSIAVRQLVAIARAVDQQARLLVLDEPTSSLDRAEAERLFATVRRLKAAGMGIIFITHFLDQVYAIAERITVLRNGARVGTFDACALPRVDLVAHMIGRHPGPAGSGAPQREAAAREAGRAGSAALSVRRLGRGRAIAPFDLDLAPGEVVGVAGLLGSGRTEMARLLFAADRPDRGGSIAVDGRPSRPRSPRDAIRLGIALTPEDRKESALFGDMSVRDNIAIVVQRTLSRAGIVNRREHTRIAAGFVRRLGIATPTLDQPVRLLSGGNQQKVVLARWLACSPRILLLDEPTRGIDIGAKAEVEALIAELAGAGLAVLLISSELDELSRRSDRVVILRDRRVVGELERAGGAPIGEDRIMRGIAG
jgi:monosaccharide-transporting ATPase